MMKYVLLGDIKNSRKLPPTTVHKVLNNLCKNINQQFDLAVPMMITLGDEWQMVCKNKAQYLEVLDYTKKQLGKIEFRAVVGKYSQATTNIGTITKFKKTMSKNHTNPLISKDFKKAHDQLSLKNDGIVVLS